MGRTGFVARVRGTEHHYYQHWHDDGTVQWLPFAPPVLVETDEYLGYGWYRSTLNYLGALYWTSTWQRPFWRTFWSYLMNEEPRP